MKKILGIVFALVLCTSTVSALAFGNSTLFDFTYTFEYAQIAMPDGTIIEGKVESWHDFESSDCVQVKISGKTYLTHYANVVMIAE